LIFLALCAFASLRLTSVELPVARIRRVGKSRTVSFHFESPFLVCGSVVCHRDLISRPVNSRTVPIFKPSSVNGPIVCARESATLGRASQELPPDFAVAAFADCDIQYASFAKAFHDRDVARPVLKSSPSLGRRSDALSNSQSPRERSRLDNGAICLAMRSSDA